MHITLTSTFGMNWKADRTQSLLDKHKYPTSLILLWLNKVIVASKFQNVLESLYSLKEDQVHNFAHGSGIKCKKIKNFLDTHYGVYQNFFLRSAFLPPFIFNQNLTCLF